MRSGCSRLTAIAMVVAASLCTAPPSHAAVTSAIVRNALLRVTGDGGNDTIVVTCVGGHVKVNGADTGTGPFACRDVGLIKVLAGGGDDRVDLSGVDPDDGFRFLEYCDVDVGAGDDVVTGSRSSDQLHGRSGDDVLRGGAGGDLFWPGGGDGVVDAGGGAHETVFLGARGSWVITDRSARQRSPDPSTIRLLTLDQIQLVGGNGPEHVNARAFSGSVIAWGKGGDDVLLSGTGDDALQGDGGKDTLIGGRGDDELRGRRGDDLLRGRRGRDHLRGDPGVDDCQGGPGQDEVVACE
jgi:Ca2+-binding RTX toxin-like protein